MKKLSLNLDALTVQSFATAEEGVVAKGTVRAFVRPTDINDTDCSAIDACVTARGCTVIGCVEPFAHSANDACPTGRGCSDLFPC
jgi:hypothetical protein